MLALVVVIGVVIPLTILFWLFNVILGAFYTGSDMWQPISPWRCLAAVILPMFMARWGYSRKSLDYSGALAGLVVGFAMTLSSMCFFGALLTFFVSASKATKFRASRKKHLEEDFKESGQRNWVQVLCNGGVAAEMAFLYMLESGMGERCVDFSAKYTSSWMAMAVLGALACSAGDTFASEIGPVVGNSEPWLITSFTRVPKGTNGGISLVGCVASVFGGLLVGLGYYLFLMLSLTRTQLHNSPTQWPIILIGGAAGLLGSTIDSILGATLQYSGFDEEKKCVVEHPGPGVDHISGVQVLDNHSVNLLTSLLTSLITPKIAMEIWQQVL